MATSSPRKSTTVRAAGSRWRLRTLRAAFRCLERIAPGLGARLAARLWCTVPATAARRRDDRPYAGASSTLHLDDGRRVAVETWGSGPPVYLVHGWGGWRGQLGALVEPLVEAGHRVVAVDAPSHGESGPGRLGSQRCIGPEFVDALVAAAGEYGKPAAMVAHSFGGTATAMAAYDGLPARRVVLIAPSTDLSAMTRLFARTLGLSERTYARMLQRLEVVAGRALSDFDIVTLAGLSGRDDLPLALIVHDRDDKEVRYDDGAALAAVWPEAELVTTEGLGHRRILRDPGVIDEIVDYVTSWRVASMVAEPMTRLPW